MSWHYIFFYRHNIPHSYLGCSLIYFSTTTYFPQTIQISRCQSTKNFQQPFAPHIFSATIHFLQQIQKYPSSMHLLSNSNFLPCNKLSGVNTSDTSSSYIKYNGQLFNTFSIPNKTVDNSVNNNLSLPVDFSKHLFTIPTNLSQNPLEQGAPSKLNFHVMPRSE